MLISVLNCTDLVIQDLNTEPVDITLSYTSNCCDESPEEITITPSPVCPDPRDEVIILVTQERSNTGECDCSSNCASQCKQRWNFKFSIDPLVFTSVTGQMMTIDKLGVSSSWSTAPTVNVTTSMEACDPYKYIYEYEVVLKTGCVFTYTFSYDFRVDEGGICSFAPDGEYIYSSDVVSENPDFETGDYEYEYDYETDTITVANFFEDLLDGVYSFTINGETACVFNSCNGVKCDVAEYIKTLLSPCEICDIDIEAAEKIKVLYDMIGMLTFCDNCCQACNTYEKLTSILNGTKCGSC